MFFFGGCVILASLHQEVDMHTVWALFGFALVVGAGVPMVLEIVKSYRAWKLERDVNKALDGWRSRG